jgi:hypothetical protein
MNDITLPEHAESTAEWSALLLVLREGLVSNFGPDIGLDIGYPD